MFFTTFTLCLMSSTSGQWLSDFYIRYDEQIILTPAPVVIYEEPEIIYKLSPPVVIYKEPVIVYRKPLQIYSTMWPGVSFSYWSHNRPKYQHYDYYHKRHHCDPPVYRHKTKTHKSYRKIVRHKQRLNISHSRQKTVKKSINKTLKRENIKFNRTKQRKATRQKSHRTITKSNDRTTIKQNRQRNKERKR